MKSFARVMLVCAAAAMFAPAATAQEGPELPFPHVRARDPYRYPDPDPNNTYNRTTAKGGSGPAGYLLIFAVFAAIAAVQYVRQTRQTLAPRRRQPWDYPEVG